MNKKIRCDIYTRVSTTMQVDGYSLDAQKEKLKRYAEFKTSAALRPNLESLNTSTNCTSSVPFSILSNMEIVNEYSDEGSLERA